MLHTRGKFISFEGGEGVGKSTQIKRLHAWLAAQGIDCVVTREPGGSPGAEAIRNLLLGNVAAFNPLAEALLFAAARVDHVAKVIAPSLARGAWVLCDRFADSTRAYQGAGSVLPVATIDTLEALAVGNTRPDLTLILDLDPVIGGERAKTRNGAAGDDRFEAESRSFHARVRAAFLDIAAREPQRCAVIDASLSVDAVSDAIAAAVLARLDLTAHARGAGA